MEDDTLPHSNFADESLSITDVVFDGENLLDEDFPNPPHRSFDDTGTEGGYIGDGTRMPYDENTKPASTPSRCSSGSPFSLSRIGLDYTPLRNATFEGIRSAFTLERNDEDSSWACVSHIDSYHTYLWNEKRNYSILSNMRVVYYRLKYCFRGTIYLDWQTHSHLPLGRGRSFRLLTQYWDWKTMALLGSTPSPKLQEHALHENWRNSPW